MGRFMDWLTGRKQADYGKQSPGTASRMPAVITAARWKGSDGTDRLFTVAPLPDGTPQAFYQSSGRSSSMPGRWLPCDGITIHPHKPGRSVWVEKSRYVGALDRTGKSQARAGMPLHRFGSQDAVQTSEALDAIPIKVVASFANPHSMNDWLVSMGFATAARHRKTAETIQASLGPNPSYLVDDPAEHDPQDLPAAGLLTHPGR